ncbi:MAG: ABC transporter substrate-binding protein [Nocardioidaceae bacterium]|nr:ABC transporter substrate-binding protein [Nocardioidaceae bacterium]
MKTRPTRATSLLVGVIAVCAALTAACGGDDSPSGGSPGKGGGSTVIGADIARTGYISAFDLPGYQTLASAAQDPSAEGPELEVKIADNKSDATTAANVATSLTDGGADLLMISCSYPIAAASTAISQARNIVAFTPCTSDQRFGPKGLGSLVYGFGLSIQSEAAAMAEFTADQGWKRVYLLEDTALDYPGRVCSGFKHRFAELGGTVAGQETFKNDDQSITSQASKIRAHKGDFDAVVLCSYPPGGGKAVLQLRQAGISTPIVSHYGMDGAFWAGGIPHLSDFYALSPASAYGDDPVPAVNDLAAAYAKETGQAPATGAFVYGADSASILRAALAKAGGAKGDALNAALEGLGTVDVLSGKVTIDPTYHAIFDRQVRVIRATDGKFGFFKLLSPKDPAALVPYTN